MANALVLAVPGLLALPSSAFAGMGSLATLARFAHAPRIDPNGVAAALFAALGVDPRTPVGPLALLGAGGDPRDDYVLRADPVHLAVHGERVMLVQTIDDLSADEAAVLVRMLDRHFADDDLRFEAIRANAWFARRRQPVRIDTTPPDAVLGPKLSACMPRGPDSGTWRRWQNEIEMMLHEHPVNAAREARGAAVVNAVWFSGGGRIADVGALVPAFVTAPATRLGDLARGIARHGGTASASIDSELASIATRATEAGLRGDVFTLAIPPPAADSRLIDSRWVAPALELFGARRVASLCLVADGHGAAATWAARLPGVWSRLTARASRRSFEVPPLPDA